MEETIEIMTAEEATQKLRAMGMKISPSMLVRGIRSHEFPFGNCIPAEKSGESPRTYVYTVLFEDWVAQRVRKVTLSDAERTG